MLLRPPPDRAAAVPHPPRSAAGGERPRRPALPGSSALDGGGGLRRRRGPDGAPVAPVTGSGATRGPGAWNEDGRYRVSPLLPADPPSNAPWHRAQEGTAEAPDAKGHVDVEQLHDRDAEPGPNRRPSHRRMRRTPRGRRPRRSPAHVPAGRGEPPCDQVLHARRGLGMARSSRARRGPSSGHNDARPRRAPPGRPRGSPSAAPARTSAGLGAPPGVTQPGAAFPAAARRAAAFPRGSPAGPAGAGSSTRRYDRAQPAGPGPSPAHRSRAAMGRGAANDDRARAGAIGPACLAAEPRPGGRTRRPRGPGRARRARHRTAGRCSRRGGQRVVTPGIRP